MKTAAQPIQTSKGARGKSPGRKLVTVRQDVLVSILERLDEMNAKLARLEGRVPPATEPSLRELAIRAAKGTPRDHDVFIARVQREAEQTGRSLNEVMKEIREAL
jgi:hypothetical protein